MSDILIIAHRGNSRGAPENTLPAIEQALEQGADMVFLEVQASADLVPMVIADTRLDRTTNGVGRVGQLTAKELQALDAGSWFGAKFKGEKVPRLPDAVKAVGDKALLMLLLPNLHDTGALADDILKALKGRKRDVLVFTDSDSLKALREKAPDFEYVLALDTKVQGWVVLEKARSLGLKVVRPYRAQINPEFIRAARSKGIKVYAHFADEESEMREVLALKVDGLMTGRPGKLKEVLREVKLETKK